MVPFHPKVLDRNWSSILIEKRMFLVQTFSCFIIPNEIQIRADLLILVSLIIHSTYPFKWQCIKRWTSWVNNPSFSIKEAVSKRASFNSFDTKKVSMVCRILFYNFLRTSHNYKTSLMKSCYQCRFKFQIELNYLVPWLPLYLKEISTPN